MTESQRNQLIVDHLPQVKIEAGKICRSLPASIEFDDVYQAGALGLLKAARRFDGRCKFWTFAEKRVQGEIFDSLRRLDHIPRRARRAAKASESEDPRFLAPRSLSTDDTGQAFDVPDAGKRPDEMVLARERQQAVIRHMGGLSPREREVMDLRYFHDERWSLGAKKLGCHESRLSQIHTSALRNLAAQFAIAGLAASAF